MILIAFAWGRSAATTSIGLSCRRSRGSAEEELGVTLAGEDLVVIGDTPADIECGRSLGVRAIGVATGSYTVEELMRCGAYAAFETLADTDRVARPSSA